jgi:hypothetical protein
MPSRTDRYIGRAITFEIAPDHEESLRRILERREERHRREQQDKEAMMQKNKIRAPHSGGFQHLMDGAEKDLLARVEKELLGGGVEKESEQLESHSPDTVSRDIDPVGEETLGFKIHLGAENVDCYLPVGQFLHRMPETDQKLMVKNPNEFLNLYAKVMITTARNRHQNQQLESENDLPGEINKQRESFDQNKFTKAQAAVLKELRAEVRG